MRVQVVHHRALRLAKGQNPECRHNMVETATAGGHREWSPHPRTNSKKLSCAASVANWNRPAWQAEARHNKSSRSFAARKKSVATILALADQARSTKSATAHRVNS